jgi:hypothetical protein
MHDSGTSVTNAPRDDIPTVCAIAVLAICATTVAHEVIGHGGACLALGGRITQLTNVYFQCSVPSVFVAPAGPAGNFFVGILAWLAQRVLPPQLSRARLLALLTMAFSFFWEAGYLVSSMVSGHGDYFTTAQDILSGPQWVWRTALGLAGLILYVLFIRTLGKCVAGFTTEPGRVSPLLGTAWLTAMATVWIAALLYAPARGDSFTGATCEILAAIPMLYPFNRSRATQSDAAPPILRSYLWIGVAVVAFSAFIATLGRGIS